MNQIVRKLSPNPEFVVVVTLTIASLILAATVFSRSACAQLPVYGKHVSELTAFDDLMQQFMNVNDIPEGVLAVGKDGFVVYQRAFGGNLPENTPMRLASVEKPIAAAAIRKLVSDGDLSLTDQVFSSRSGTSGILPHEPWNGAWGDNRLGDITVEDLMNHQGGWNHTTLLGTPPLSDEHGDPQFLTLQIAQRMDIPSPAGPDDIIRFMLSQPLQYDPGTNGCVVNGTNNSTFCYSNFGYMVLGQIVEEVSGTSLLNFYRSRVLSPAMWVPRQEIFTGRSLRTAQNPREPSYLCSFCSVTNIFDATGPSVQNPYGGFHLEAFTGHGNLVSSAAPLLTYMDHYRVGVQAMDGAGLPVPLLPFNGRPFQGGMDGTSTCMWQRGDGINIVVLFPTRRAGNMAQVAAQLVSNTIDASISNWPTLAVDGFWIDFAAPPSNTEVGGYDHPFRNLDQGLAVGAGAKIRLKPGSSTWTGTISHKVQIDAPLGTAIIGN